MCSTRCSHMLFFVGAKRRAWIKQPLVPMTRLEHRTPHRHMWQFLYGYFRVNGCLIRTEIIDIRFGSLFRLTHPNRFARDDPGNLSGRIMHVSCNDSVLGADDDAGRLQAKLSAMCTIIAL